MRTDYIFWKSTLLDRISKYLKYENTIFVSIKNLQFKWNECMNFNIMKFTEK